MRHAALSTGFAVLDRALEIGGIPRSHITEIFGPIDSGKTALALQIVAAVQHSQGAAAWIDAENSFDPPFAAQLGVDLASLPVAKPATAEEALEMARRFTASGAVDLVVVDSAAALVPELEMAASFASPLQSLQGRLLGSELRKLSLAAMRSGAAVVFLNQLRIRLKGPAGAAEVSAGGPPLKLYASVRIGLAAAGRTVRFRILKNRLGTAFVTGDLSWRPGRGFVETP
jgi:recombination protein RecA